MSTLILKSLSTNNTQYFVECLLCFYDYKKKIPQNFENNNKN